MRISKLEKGLYIEKWYVNRSDLSEINMALES